MNEMPFKSKAQQKFLYANKPSVAKKFAKKTPSIKSLPEKLIKRKPMKKTKPS